jgi:hypothetical protein
VIDKLIGDAVMAPYLPILKRDMSPLSDRVASGLSGSIGRQVELTLKGKAATQVAYRVSV